MTRITLVAALARNRVIGAGGAIPWHLPDDFAHFKALTMGHTLIMGRGTFDSIGRPLPGRRTIVVTRSDTWTHPGVSVAHSLPAALASAGPVEEVFVVGGGQIYAQALPLADRMVLSHVALDLPGDTYFPVWSAPDWVEVARVPHETFEIVTYERR